MNYKEYEKKMIQHIRDNRDYIDNSRRTSENLQRMTNSDEGQVLKMKITK